jgi:hypothetical protein
MEPFRREIVVLHGEFSLNRGPQLAPLFSAIDREMNMLACPNLFYPKVYVLDEEYKGVDAQRLQFCSESDTRRPGDILQQRANLTCETL